MAPQPNQHRRRWRGVGAIVFLLALASPACRTYQNATEYCDENNPCVSGTCDMGTRLCKGDGGFEPIMEGDAPSDGNQSDRAIAPGDAPTLDAADAEAAFACKSDDDCKGNANGPACDPHGKCVACTDNYCRMTSSSTPICENSQCVECTPASNTNCTGNTPVCGTDNKCHGCQADTECQLSAPACETTDQDMNQGSCVGCTDAFCAKIAAKPVCEPINKKTCVQCTDSKKHCAGDNPICGSDNRCHPCTLDSDCVAAYGALPGLCYGGRCATDSDSVYVEFNQNGCPGANGSVTAPYCTPNNGVSALASAKKKYLVIIGAVNDQLVMNTNSLTPVVIGRPNGTNAGSIPAVSATGILVSSDNVVIRDLSIGNGTTSASKGIVISGFGTKVQLQHLTISLGNGLGVDAEAGTSLQMDRCLLQNNMAGGVLINGAGYQIANSILTSNLYGLKFTAAAIPTSSQVLYSTIVANQGNAVTCDTTNAQPINESIVVGVNDSCTLNNDVTTMTAFDSARPFHLTGPLGCPSGDPTTIPDHDYDGESRSKPTDCGADQH